MIVQTKKRTLYKTVILQLIIAGFILFIIGCSEGKEKFIGKHTIGLPIYTTKYDTTINIREFGNIAHPEINYYDLYTSTIDIYKTDGNKLEGKLKYVYPDAGKWYNEKSTIQEQTLELKSLHVENDTLLFLIEAGTMSPKFEGCSYMDGGSMVVGLPKKLFKWIHKEHCTETLYKESIEYLFFKAGQLIDKKKLYKCQADSLKNFIISNPKYINRYKPTIDYLNQMSK